MIELFLREVAQPSGQPWCAAFVHHVGYWSHYDHDGMTSSWPLPPTASCWVLGDFARKHDALVDVPAPGDVFLKYDATLKRFAHTGIVVQVPRARTTGQGQLCYLCVSIEGNTTDGGSREGDAVVRRVRRLNPEAGDMFIRWVALDRRDAAAAPVIARAA